jgi:hypothetical protein
VRLLMERKRSLTSAKISGHGINIQNHDPIVSPHQTCH